MKFKIITRDWFQRGTHGIWLFQCDENDRPIKNAKPANIEFEPIDGSGAFALPTPWMEIPRRDMQDIFQQLTDALVDYGFKPKTEVSAAQVEILREFLKREQSNHDRVFRLLEDLK